MICEHCGCFFCPDECHPSAPRQRFCRPQCKVRTANKRRRKEGRTPAARAQVEKTRRVRHESKIRYRNEQAALSVSERWPDKAFQAYNCDLCDGWHLRMARGSEEARR